MALPSKLYPNYDRTSEEGFSFLTRDPAAEMEYTAKTLAEVMKVGGYWAQAETAVGETLKSRFNSVEDALYTSLSTHWSNKLTEITNNVFPSGSTNDLAYTQYLAGMSAAMGGGHTSITMFQNITTQEKRLSIVELANKNLQMLAGLTFDATKSMPLVVPVESQLVADACASGVEANAVGQIRSQQIRQSIAAGNIMEAISPGLNINSEPAPIDEVVQYGSIHAAGAAAKTK